MIFWFLGYWYLYNATKSGDILFFPKNIQPLEGFGTLRGGINAKSRFISGFQTLLSC